MAYSSDSSSSEDLGAALDYLDVVAEEEITMAAWYSERRSEDEGYRDGDNSAEDLITVTARAYQLEMLEASLRENVIVAMDTGSGKTQVYDLSGIYCIVTPRLTVHRAVLRIKTELEKMSPDKVRPSTYSLSHKYLLTGKLDHLVSCTNCATVYPTI